MLTNSAFRKILLAHGSGGRLMHNLIKELFLKKLGNPVLNELADSARIACRGQIAFTTDSFVVSPWKFPGADIGKLAVCGTVNDLVMAGAKPEYLALALIIEEGLDYRLLEEIIDSISLTAKKSGAWIATGDVKVVEKGACDKIFINTSGLGRILKGRRLSLKNIRPQDKIIVTGPVGEHGLAVLSSRKDFGAEFKIKSDCASLNSLLLPILEKTTGIKFMRDPTRGGIATTLNEIAEGTNLSLVISEEKVPVSSRVKVAAELLGIDYLYSPCEGRAVLIVAESSSHRVLNLLRQHPLGCQARLIGEVISQPKGNVILKTVIGSERILDMLTLEQLPRIC